MEKTTIKQLSNGIRVVLDPIPYVRSASIGIWVKAGSADEEKQNNGIAHVIEHMMFKGTSTRTAKDLADEMTAIGGLMDAYTTKEYTCYYTRTLDVNLGRAVDILGDMLTASLIDEKDLEKEIGVILEEIDMYEDDPDELVHELLQKEVWTGHSIGYIISGEKEGVRAFKRNDILDFMDRYYTADKMVVSVSGHFDEAELMRQLESALGSIKPVGKETEISQPVYHRAFVTRQKEVEQVYLNIALPGIRYGHEDKYAFTLFNNILGGGMNSRLFQEIREDKGLTYSIYSYGSSYRHSGLIQMNASMSSEQLTEVIEGIYESVERLLKHGIDERELQLTKAQIETELVLGNESTRGRMEYYGKRLLYNNEIQHTDDIITKLDSTSLKAVNDFMNRYMKMDQASVCLIGDLKDIDIEAIKRLFSFHETNK